MQTKELYWLGELSQEHSDLVGKKCANLGELTRMGLKVPNGFALSVKAYEHFMTSSGLTERIEKIVEDVRKAGTDMNTDLEKVISMSAQIREAIEAEPMPLDLAAAITENYRALSIETGTNQVACAIRSSGAVSMPGQMETFLNIEGEKAIIDHVKRVWASAFTTRAIHFRIYNAMPISWAPIGVAVIMMVEAKSAGVILTVLPSCGDVERAIVEGNFGLGESVVSGEVTPDSFIVDKKGMIIESRTIGQKTKMVVYCENGTTVCGVPEPLQKTQCLEDREVLEIVRVALDVESHFGAPQDMEWVVDKRFPFPNNIFWVQARRAKYAKKEESKDNKYVIDLMLQQFRN